MMAEELAGELNNRFFLLARRFWPGPADHHRAGVAEGAAQGHRQHRPAGAAPVALARSPTQLIALLNQPLISTSANISGHPTCRSGIDVFGMMDGRVDLVLDGGTCTGPGATTVDITEPLLETDQGRRDRRRRKSPSACSLPER